jgi:hypothetical protein
LATGYFSIFVVAGLLRFPLISRNRDSYTFCTLPDADNGLFPPIRCTFFDIRKEATLFRQYLSFLKALLPEPSRVSVLSIVRVLDRYCVSDRIPVVFFTCDCFLDRREDFSAYASGRAFDGATHVEIFAMRAGHTNVDFSALCELSLYMNSRVHFCDSEEFAILPSLLTSSLFDYKVSDVLLMCTCSPSLKVVDILGCGVRLADRSFGLTSIGVDDCVYFYFDYDVSSIKSFAPSIQFQIRYFDPLGRRVIRVCTAFFSLVDNMNSCAQSVDYDIFAASIVVRSLDKQREFGKLKTVEESLRALGATFLGDPLCTLFLLNGDKFWSARTEEILLRGPRLLNPLCLSSLMGKSPDEIAAFFAPIGFSLNLSFGTPEGPFLVNRKFPASGACYIKLFGRRGVLVLAAGENVAQWIECSGNGQLMTALGPVLDEISIELLTPVSSNSHPLWIHLTKCFESR